LKGFNIQPKVENISQDREKGMQDNRIRQRYIYKPKENKSEYALNNKQNKQSDFDNKMKKIAFGIWIFVTFWIALGLQNIVKGDNVLQNIKITVIIWLILIIIPVILCKTVCS